MRTQARDGDALDGAQGRCGLAVQCVHQRSTNFANEIKGATATTLSFSTDHVETSPSRGRAKRRPRLPSRA